MELMIFNRLTFLKAQYRGLTILNNPCTQNIEITDIECVLLSFLSQKLVIISCHKSRAPFVKILKQKTPQKYAKFSWHVLARIVFR